jgi:pimeloyl-ACP methyl ester carboxylesterase
MDTKLPQQTRASRRSIVLLLLLVPCAIATSVPSINTHLRAASLLMRIENPQDQSSLARYETYNVAETDFSFATSEGMVPSSLYTPIGIAHPPHIMIVHGVHHLGIHDPRIIAFARALAAGGVQVFTPEMRDLTDYHVTPAVIDTIGAAARQFSRNANAPIGVLGISFSGSLSLIAAADPRNTGSIAFVVSLGSHENMERVARFFLTGATPRPDGSVGFVKPHEYGSLVLLYSHPEDFFPAKDLPAARECLKRLLWEDVDGSKRVAQQLGPRSRTIMNQLYAHDRESLEPALLKTIDRHAAEMQAVSADHKLVSLHVPVLLLHGSADDVIPNTELLWLAHEVPAADLRGALVTPLLSHLDVAGDPSTEDKWQLIQFMSTVLDLADETRSSGRAT